MTSAVKFVDVGGRRLAYVEAGPPEAPAVLFLHGWASSSRMWRATQRALAPAFHSVAFDLPGHGASDKPEWEWYTITNFTEWVRQASQALGLRRLAMVGHSMGGTIALELTSEPGSEVERLVLVNPVVSGQVSQLARPIRETWMRPVIGVSRRLWPVASRLLTRPPAGVRARLPDHVLRNGEDLAQTTADSALGSIRAVLQWDVRPRLEGIRAPTLVIVGDSDRTVPPREGLLAASRIHGARVVRLHAGHQPSDETPDEFQGALTAFLAPMLSRRM